PPPFSIPFDPAFPSTLSSFKPTVLFLRLRIMRDVTRSGGVVELVDSGLGSISYSSSQSSLKYSSLIRRIRISLGGIKISHGCVFRSSGSKQGIVMGIAEKPSSGVLSLLLVMSEKKVSYFDGY
nr:hypothetical protein [Tanacetum cinerariifolium]